jgi:hypothetical protein
MEHVNNHAWNFNIPNSAASPSLHRAHRLCSPSHFLTTYFPQTHAVTADTAVVERSARHDRRGVRICRLRPLRIGSVYGIIGFRTISAFLRTIWLQHVSQKHCLRLTHIFLSQEVPVYGVIPVIGISYDIALLHAPWCPAHISMLYEVIHAYIDYASLTSHYYTGIAVAS